MAWTGTILNVSKTDGRATIAVQISGPLGIFNKAYTIDFLTATGAVSEYSTWLKRQVIQWATQIEAVYAFADAAKNAPAVDFTPDPVVVDPAYTAFVANCVKLRQLSILKNDEVIANDRAELVAVRATVLTAIVAHPEWLAAVDNARV